jgi:hypothetical protein
MRFIVTLVLLTLSVFSFAREIDLKVTLSPAGDFSAKSTKVRGFINRNGAQYTADDLSIEVGQLKTGIELRDKHLHERLGGAKAKIIVKKAAGSHGKGKAMMTVNSITKPIGFAFKESNNMILAKIAVKPSDFGIKDVKYLGIGVEDKVLINVKIPLR